jgi:biopolymer transport protein ExbD
MSEISDQPQSSGKVRTKKLSTRIDMTPMVDLAFLSLTFFILTNELKTAKALKIEMPDNSEQQPVNAKKVLTIILDGHDKIYWFTGVDPKAQQTSFSAEGIRKIVKEKNASIPKMLVIIKASNRSHFKNLVDILDEMIILNIERYAIVDITAEDLGLIRQLDHPLQKTR